MSTATKSEKVYAVCVQTTPFSAPTRVSEKIYKTFGAANRAFNTMTANMPYHKKINYSVLLQSRYGGCWH